MNDFQVYLSSPDLWFASLASISCNLIEFLLGNIAVLEGIGGLFVKLTESKITRDKSLWECLCGRILIVIIDVEEHTHCGYHHSLSLESWPV